MQNYHKHTYWSNISTPDSCVSYQAYADRVKELGHKVLSSVEHGWQGNYFEAFDVAKKNGLKFVFGCEAYWVKDRLKEYDTGRVDKNKKPITQLDGSNKHIIILARNERGRRAINNMLSEANISGYYYKPRIDRNLIFQLPPKDVFITSACIEFDGYDDTEDIIKSLHDYFGKNFMLEIQYYDNDKQKAWNRKLKEWSKKYNIEMIVGLDSHYIKPEQSEQRDYFLKSFIANKNYTTDDILDYPDDATVVERFLQQGIFSQDEIQRAMDNTDVCLEFDDYDNERVFTTDIKLPNILYKDKTLEEKNEIFGRLITKQFKKYMKEIDSSRYDEYFNAVKDEVKTWTDTKMVDYPLLNYRIINEAKKMGGMLTLTGRGSASSFFTNTLLGFSTIDRLSAPIQLFPSRFMSTTRILETHSLPDIDFNCGNIPVFEKAQEKVLGKDHAIAMCAYGTYKKKSAFKMFARAVSMDFQLANTISEQLGAYDKAVSHADEGEEINLADYVDEQYMKYVEESKTYQNIVVSRSKAPSAYLLYDGNIREEIGLFKCKSKTTKKEYLTCIMDGAVAEKNKFLKNDLLKVDVVPLIIKIFERIGIKPFTAKELEKIVENDSEVWDLYANGYTIGLNQCEKPSARKKLMAYKPHSVAELTAFVAAIRPSFQSMYKQFESRESFDYGIPALDKIIQTPQMPYSYLLYQESVMNILYYAGFPMSECYSAIKAIAKKHPEKVVVLKQRFMDGFNDRLINEEHVSLESANETSEKVWRIVEDSCGYGFNCSHAYSVALDSLYNAWQKAHYPYEFYEFELQYFCDKGNKAKVALLKKEMTEAFGIEEGAYKFGLDNRHFSSDKEHHVINPALKSIKDMSDDCAEALWKLGQKQYDNFIDLCIDMQSVVKRNQLDILIHLNYFRDFAKSQKILKFVEAFNSLYGKKQFNKENNSEVFHKYFSLIEPFFRKTTPKQYREFDSVGALKTIWDYLPDIEVPVRERLTYEYEKLGYNTITNYHVGKQYVFVQEYECKYKNPKLTVYHMKDGAIEVIKIKANKYQENPINQYDVIEMVDVKEQPIWVRDGWKDEACTKPNWVRDYSRTETLLNSWNFIGKHER